MSAALILVALLLIYYNSVVFRGNSFLTTIERTYQAGHYHYSGTYWHVARKKVSVDPAAAVQINLPSAYLENHYLKTFQLPLWNPFSGLGRPYHGDMNSYTFFLPMYLFKLFPSLFMYDLFLLLRVFIAGFFLFLLLRLYRCSFWIAMAGASFFMFNSYFHAFMDMDHLNVTMFLSPMVYFLTKSLFSMNKKYLIGFLLCSAGSFYGGNPNEFILVHLFVTFYFAFLVLSKNDLGIQKKLNLLLAYGMALVLSILLTSMKLIPFIEFWNNSVSSRAGGLVGTSVFLSFKKFLGWILLPDTMQEGPNYIGFMILTLVFYSFFNLVRKKWRIREKILASHFVLLFLIISKITAAPYINWIGTWPLLNSIHYVKYSSLLYYIVSVLSSFSLIYLVENIKRKRQKVLRLSLFLFCCGLPHMIFWAVTKKSILILADNGQLLLYLFIPFLSIGSFLILLKKTYKNKVIVSCGVAILALLAVFELRINNHQNYRKRFKINDKAPYTQFLLRQEQPFRTIGINVTFMPNCNLVYPLPAVNRMFAMRVNRSTSLLSQLVSNKFNSGMGHRYLKEEILDNPFLDFLNTKYYISESIHNSIVIDPHYANSHNVKSLINNPLMQYTHCGNLYSYLHRGWRQLADSSVDIPVRLPYGDVYIKSTALAYNFNWRKRNLNNMLSLIISIKQESNEEIVYNKKIVAQREQIQDFFNIKVDLRKYAGKDVVINITLKNPEPKNENDRMFFFGDLRIISNRVKKSIAGDPEHGNLSILSQLEPVPYEEVFSHHAIVYKNNRASERAFLLYHVKQVDDFEEAIAIMKKEPLIYKKTALLEGNLPSDIKLGKEGQSKVAFLDYQANQITIDVETTENSVFVLSDAYYPGWKAYLDGKEVNIYPAFGALRAVFIPRGGHELKFCYRPWTFYLGAFLTFLSLISIGFVYFFKSEH